MNHKPNMHQDTTSNPAIAHRFQDDRWFQSLLQAPTLSFGALTTTEPAVRLIRLDEINDEKHQAYRQALANVYAALDPEQNMRLLYLLDGSPRGVALYFGVTAVDNYTDVHEAMKNLRGALEGQLPGINFGEEVTLQDRQAIFNHWSKWSCQGVMLGVPTAQAEEDIGKNKIFRGLTV